MPITQWGRARSIKHPFSFALISVFLLNGLLPQGALAATNGAVSSTSSPLPPNVLASPVLTDQLISGGRKYEISLQRLGAEFPMILRGIEGSHSLPFNIRADEVVSSVRLRLKYAYSPALISELSHINILVNGELANSIPVPKETAGANQETVIDLPQEMITQFNTLNIQLIGHYTMECEDPLHSSLWANISNRSTLEVTVTPLTLANDLSILPLPFFDYRDARALNLPFVFATQPDNAMLEAAGTLSSWFGALASYRGAKFPTAIGSIPDKGNAIVLVTGELRTGGLDVNAPTGPTLAIVPNPNDQYGKLLLIGGRDAKEIKRAVQAVVTGSKALTGQHAVITQLAELKARQPYDAPNWLRTDRPVKLGELTTPKKLNVSGFAPPNIPVDLRLPPDLFGWREKGIPLNLKYRYTPQQLSTSSSMTVSVNGQLLKSYPLPSIARLDGGEGLLAKLNTDSSIPVQTDLKIPLQITPPRSQLQFRYQYDYIKQGECRDVIIDNVRGAIEPDSTLDISGYSHYIAMPDLAVFQNSGFPFTRMADLSQTAVILPNGAGPVEYSAYLEILGRLSESTGYPATAVTVANADQIESLANKDLLILASGNNQPLLERWSKQLPVSLNGNDRRFNFSDLVYKAWNWVVPNPRDNVDPARNSVSFTTDGANAVFLGFESPLQSGRSVVAISSTRPAALSEAVSVLAGASPNQYLQGSVAVVRGQEVESLVSNPTYYTGSLGPLKAALWFASRHPWLVVLLALLGIALLSIPIYFALRRRATQRLDV